MEPLNYEKRGYLNEDFRLFHLADSNTSEIGYHYHNFHKIILLLAGKASYAIEGERYKLTPGDYVLVSRGSIHRPEVEPGAFYERMILYISPEFLARLRTDDCNLERCFHRAQSDFHYVYHAGADNPIKPLFLQLEQAWNGEEFGAEILRQSLFMHLMVEVNRATEGQRYIRPTAGDSKIVSLLQYLNLHLTEALSIDELSSRFYISKYYMMRRFKEETGYTIHNYITEKRLLLAQQQIQQGASLTEACYQSGYQDYSTFSRAYKKRFGHVPSGQRLTK
ncbi:MAG: AraC family transcriptional regulator [Clostridiales bacterium]|nr:AraC family transcriptional regulator [Candidatus Cacconaster stercorequi]